MIERHDSDNVIRKVVGNDDDTLDAVRAIIAQSQRETDDVFSFNFGEDQIVVVALIIKSNNSVQIELHSFASEVNTIFKSFPRISVSVNTNDDDYRSFSIPQDTYTFVQLP